MSGRDVPHLRLRIKQRDSFYVPNKVFKLQGFANDRPACPNSTAIHHLYTNPQEPSFSRKLKLITLEHSPKQQPSNRNRLNFEDFIDLKKEQVSLPRHSLKKQQNVLKVNLSIRNAQDTKRMARRYTEQEKAETLRSRKSLYLDTKRHEQMKNQLQERFMKTRLLFKQQLRAKNLDRIYKISKFAQKKTLTFKNLHKSADINHLARQKQQDKFTPWNRSGSHDHECYEISQTGQYCD